MAETLQLEARHGRDYLSRSAHIDKRAVCNQQGTVMRIAVIDPPAADSADVLRCTSIRIEGGPHGHTQDDTAAAMDGEIMGSGEGGAEHDGGWGCRAAHNPG